MSEGGGKGKKRSKQFYRKSAAKKKKGLESLEVGMKGFLITCNKDEKSCVREAYNIFNEYADRIYGPEHMSESSSDEDDPDDIDAALKKETKKLKAQEAKKDRRFQSVRSGANNVVFIKSQIHSPSEFAQRIVSDVAESKKKVVRHVQRIIPVDGTCKANLEQIKNLCSVLPKPVLHHAESRTKTYAVDFKARCNNSLKKTEVVDMLAREFIVRFGYHVVDLKYPDYTIICQVIKNVCCMSIVKDFYDLHRYNLHLISWENTSTENETAVGDDSAKRGESNNSNQEIGQGEGVTGQGEGAMGQGEGATGSVPHDQEYKDIDQVEEDKEQKKKSNENLFKEDPPPNLPIWISDMLETERETS